MENTTIQLEVFIFATMLAMCALIYVVLVVNFKKENKRLQRLQLPSRIKTKSKVIDNLHHKLFQLHYDLNVYEYLSLLVIQSAIIVISILTIGISFVKLIVLAPIAITIAAVYFCYNIYAVTRQYEALIAQRKFELAVYIKSLIFAVQNNPSDDLLTKSVAYVPATIKPLLMNLVNDVAINKQSNISFKRFCKELAIENIQSVLLTVHQLVQNKNDLTEAEIITLKEQVEQLENEAVLKLTKIRKANTINYQIVVAVCLFIPSIFFILETFQV